MPLKRQIQDEQEAVNFTISAGAPPPDREKRRPAAPISPLKAAAAQTDRPSRAKHLRESRRSKARKKRSRNPGPQYRHSTQKAAGGAAKKGRFRRPVVGTTPGSSGAGEERGTGIRNAPPRARGMLINSVSFREIRAGAGRACERTPLYN